VTRPGAAGEEVARGGPPRLEPFGEAAWLVILGGGIDPAINRWAHRIAERVRADRAEGGPWELPVASYEAVLVPFDPWSATARQAGVRLERLLADVPPTDPASDRQRPGEGVGAIGPIVELPTHYGGADGPDLDAVAGRLGLSPAALVEAHATPAYQVYLLGFSPGFAYLGPLPEALQLPRREVPRGRVPAGSVAIAGAQTAVYPSATPGGWHLIGRTAARLWDATRDPPALLTPGQLVRFVPFDGGI
jgi:inhibitor of KinA